MIWTEFLNPQYKVCGLCGNTGIINTSNSATSMAGIRTGGLHYCVCPNGRTLKKLKVKLEEHLAQFTVNQEKVDFLVACDSLRELMADSVGGPTLIKEDFVKIVRSLGWNWDEFKQQLRDCQSLADNIFDKIRGFTC